MLAAEGEDLNCTLVASEQFAVTRRQSAYVTLQHAVTMANAKLVSAVNGVECKDPVVFLSVSDDEQQAAIRRENEVVKAVPTIESGLVHLGQRAKVVLEQHCRARLRGLISDEQRVRIHHSFEVGDFCGSI